MKKNQETEKALSSAVPADECALFEELIWKNFKGALSDLDERRLKSHLQACPSCSLYCGDCSEIFNRVHAGIDREDPSPDFVRTLGEKCAASIDKQYRRGKAVNRIRSVAYGFGMACLAATLVMSVDRVAPPAAATELPQPKRVQTIWTIPNIAAFKESRACAPVLCGDNVFTIEKSGRSGRIVSVDIRKGTVVWRSSSETVGYLSADSHRVYGIALHNATPVLQAFDARSGACTWEFSHDDHGAGGDPTTPAVLGSSVYWSAGNSVYAVEAQNGRAQWKKQFGANAPVSAVSVCLGTICVATGEGVYCFNQQGKELWMRPFPEPMILSAAPQMTSDDGSVFVSHRTMFGNSFLLCLSGKNGARQWQLDDVDVRLMLAAEGHVFVRSRDLRSFDQKNGALQWRQMFDGCAPITCADHVLFVSEAAEKGLLVSLDVRSGNVIGVVQANGSCTGVLVSHGMEVVHSIDGTLYAFSTSLRHE